MRIRLSCLALLIAGTLPLLRAEDNTLGTWKRNIEKSTNNRPSKNPYTSLTTVREGIPGGVRAHIRGVRQDGSVEEMSYTAKYDGTPVSLSGGAFDRLSVKQVDANTLLIENWKEGGKYRTKSTSVVAPDGRTLVNTLRGTDGQGNPLEMTIVYEKQ